MGSENSNRYAQNTGNGFAFDFLEQYHQDGNAFFNNIVCVTGDETWLSIVNVETKRAFKAVNAHTFTKHAKNV
jgi:hypothetical protein